MDMENDGDENSSGILIIKPRRKASSMNLGIKEVFSNVGYQSLMSKSPNKKKKGNKVK